jgi:hypothetical protein
MCKLIRTLVILSLVLVFAFQAKAHRNNVQCAALLHATNLEEVISNWRRWSEALTRRICEGLIISVREALLAEEPELRDEAYTTILWLRMDAEAFLGQGDYFACIKAMIVVKQIAGIK